MAILFSKSELAYIKDKEQFSKRQQRDIRYRLRKKLTALNQELPLENSGGAAEFRDGMNKNGTDSLLSQAVAPSNFYAPWSGPKQCEQDPCWKAYGNSSHRIWQTAGSG